MVQDRVSAVKDNSMRAGIEDDLDRGVSALISTTKLCQNVGKECKVKSARGKKRLSKFRSTRSENESVANHSAMYWAESIKWV